MDKVRDSILSSAIVDARIVPNGIDLSVFQPYPKRKARAELKLPLETRVMLAVANNLTRNIWKDYETLVGALARVAESLSRSQVQLVVLGEQAPSEQAETVNIRFLPHTADARKVARYYQAADVYVHAAKVDTFPSTVLEALACGTPVVATKVGGIPDQIEDGVTGYLVPIGNREILAERIVRLLSDDDLRHAMSIEASTSAKQQFGLARQADDYLTWYQDILHNWRPEYTRARSIRD
jgi:glycosyltransferase involved in cell wall biosynthesis